MTLRALRNAVLQLPLQERVKIAEDLLGSLPGLPRARTEAEWVVEALRRDADLDSGKAKAIPWTNVRRRLFRRARQG